MSSTYNHTLMASAVAIIASDKMPANENSITWKIIVLLCLLLSHAPMDAIVHWHWYKFSEIKKKPFGAIVELGGGLILIPYLVWLTTGIDPVWLMLCVVAASGFDFLVATGIKVFYDFNHWLHWWEEKTTETKKMLWEQNQFLILFSILVMVIVNRI